MLKAIIALVITLVVGWIGAVIGFEFLGGFTEIGPIAAIAVMGAFIICFNDKRK